MAGQGGVVPPFGMAVYRLSGSLPGSVGAAQVGGEAGSAFGGEASVFVGDARRVAAPRLAVRRSRRFWRLGVLRCGFALAGVREVSALSWSPGEGFPANAKSLVDGVFRGVPSRFGDTDGGDCHAGGRPAW